MVSPTASRGVGSPRIPRSIPIGQWGSMVREPLPSLRASAQLGNRVAAVAHAREVLLRKQDFTVSGYLQTLHFQRPSDTEHVREGLLKAGLPG